SYGADVEAEIGRVGGAEGDYKSVDVLVTSVEEAKRFAEETGVDALAVAIGTAHGNYKEQPVLRIDRLKEIAAVVKTPLVLHGGTGLTDEDFRQCIANGIQKINIATASYDSSADCIRKVAAEKPDARYFDFSEAIVEGTYENVKKHMEIFGMKDKA
ncbi:MAG: class II fructose-bisphosphate aldolase, partial [Selenomonas massiliensis]